MGMMAWTESRSRKHKISERIEPGAREKSFHVPFDVPAKYLEYTTKIAKVRFEIPKECYCCSDR